jgi:membrane protein
VRYYRFVSELTVAAAIGLGAAFVMAQIAPSGSSARDRQYEAKTAHRSQQGSAADDPTDIPAGGWFDILRRTYHEVDRDRVRAVAAGVTFYALLALFPALTAFVSIYGLVSEPGTIGQQLSVADGLLPAGSTDFLRDQITRITEAGDTKLGFAFLFSLLLAI